MIMIRSTALAITALSLTLTFGCKQHTTATSDTRPAAPSETTASQDSVTASKLTPEELGELGARIKAAPADARKLLSAKGLDERSFEQAIRKVAESPEESKRYAAAFKKSDA
jgi:nucleotide-binding universal stress UspA family protein